MQYSKTFLLAAMALFFSILVGGCLGTNTTSTPTSVDTTKVVPAADQKSGETTKTGSITQAGDVYFLTELGDSPKQIESYAVDLSQYVGQTVTVTGQYSGDTLFVGKVE